MRIRTFQIMPKPSTNTIISIFVALRARQHTLIHALRQNAPGGHGWKSFLTRRQNFLAFAYAAGLIFIFTGMIWPSLDDLLPISIRRISKIFIVGFYAYDFYNTIREIIRSNRKQSQQKTHNEAADNPPEDDDAAAAPVRKKSRFSFLYTIYASSCVRIMRRMNRMNSSPFPILFPALISRIDIERIFTYL